MKKIVIITLYPCCNSLASEDLRATPIQRRRGQGAAIGGPSIDACTGVSPRRRIRPEFDSWEAHGAVWSASRLRQNKYLRVREGRFEPKRLDTWISEIYLPTAHVDEYYWIHVLCVSRDRSAPMGRS